MAKWTRKEKAVQPTEDAPVQPEAEAAPAAAEGTESGSAVVPAMTDEDRDAALAEYVRNQEVRLQRTLEKRKEAFSAKLANQQETQAHIAARLLRIKQLRGEIQERRDSVKKLKQEIRDLRPKKAPIPEPVVEAEAAAS